MILVLGYNLPSQSQACSFPVSWGCGLYKHVTNGRERDTHSFPPCSLPTHCLQHSRSTSLNPCFQFVMFFPPRTWDRKTSGCSISDKSPPTVWNKISKLSSGKIYLPPQRKGFFCFFIEKSIIYSAYFLCGLNSLGWRQGKPLIFSLSSFSCYKDGVTTFKFFTFQSWNQRYGMWMFEKNTTEVEHPSHCIISEIRNVNIIFLGNVNSTICLKLYLPDLFSVVTDFPSLSLMYCKQFTKSSPYPKGKVNYQGI